MAILLGWGLTSDPSEVPSALTGKPLPAFDLPALDGAAQSLAARDVAPEGVTVINVFASWCVPCRAEHPILTDIAGWDGVTLYGIAYKNAPEEARAWLDELGVYGVPETFFVSADGNIRYKHIGPIMEHHVEERIRPLVERLTQ
jgi:cytochrome c biogenesis protein CcmG/thiol:disulfide interchange protein DsbE